MFKKRTIGLFGAALAGFALIGGTFAAWVVTDNANPFGIAINPANPDVDQHDYVTLKYGQSTSYADLNNLQKETHRLAAVVGLVADTSNSQTYTGKVTMEIVDETTNREENQPCLTDYLTVELFNVTVTADQSGNVTNETYNALSNENRKISITSATQGLQGEANFTVSDNVETLVYVVVSLGDVDAPTLQIIKNDDVTLRIDWQPILGQDDITGKTVYAKAVENKYAYVYAWEGSQENAAWPGVAMKEEYGGYYSYNLSSEYSNLIFVLYNDAQHTSEYKKSNDLNPHATKNCYDMTNENKENWAWDDDPQLDPYLINLVGDYFLVGSFADTDWHRLQEYVLTVDGSDPNQYHINGIELNAGDKLKVQSRNGANFFTNAGIVGEYYTLDNTDVKIAYNQSGTYNITLYVEHNQGNHIALEKVA